MQKFVNLSVFLQTIWCKLIKHIVAGHFLILTLCTNQAIYDSAFSVEMYHHFVCHSITA